MLEAGGSVDGRLPETVQGIVTARIDLLPADEKELLQQASVLGKVFWSDALARRRRARSRGSCRRRSGRSSGRSSSAGSMRSAVAGASQYAFEHALVRDAAYGQIPRAASRGSPRRARRVDRVASRGSLGRSRSNTCTPLHDGDRAVPRGGRGRRPGLRALRPAPVGGGERALLLHAYPAAARSSSRLSSSFRKGGADSRPALRGRSSVRVRRSDQRRASARSRGVRACR